MNDIFLTVLNMSLTGAFVIAAICLARLPLKKAPKIISYCLWAAAGFRLVFPFSFESAFSLIPFKARPIPADIAMRAVPRIDSGIPAVNSAVSGLLPAATPHYSVNSLQVWIFVGSLIWLTAAAALLIYGVASYILLKLKLRTAAPLNGIADTPGGAVIYEANNIQSPFVLGLLRPGIYLPAGLPARERGHVILHERRHIRRGDHIVKFAAYLVLCLHWFNPLVWAAFLLMGADMEMSCDERVLKEMGGTTRKEYSLSLLSLATERRVIGIGGSPLAFGEVGVKQRVMNVLNFKKPPVPVVVIAAALSVALGAGFAVNRANDAAANPDAKAATAAFEPRVWVDFYRDGGMARAGSYDLSLDEFPGVTFGGTDAQVTAARDGGVQELIITGMPVWNVYLADLNGDGLPEFCATVSMGSGIIDTRVVVHDYAAGATYDLSDRFYYDYALSLADGRLTVTQTEYADGATRSAGSMAIVDGELVTYGIDRSLPAEDAVATPGTEVTTATQDAKVATREPRVQSTPVPDEAAAAETVVTTSVVDRSSWESLYPTEADFLNSPDGVAFQAVAYRAAKAYLDGDKDELDTLLTDLYRVPEGMRDFDFFKDVEYMTLKWSLRDIVDLVSLPEIYATYEFQLKGEDSVSYITLTLVKEDADSDWKVDYIALGK